MATDFSKNNVPLEGPMGKSPSNLSSGLGASQAAAAGFGAPKGDGQDFVKNPVPLESAPSPLNTDWLQMARDNYSVAKNYFDISVRRRIEDNLAHAFSRHASGSKYYHPEFDKRSKHFRPKTRSMMRKQEAACAIAFFSTQDVLDCQPLDDDNPDQVLASHIHQELLNYRLRHTIPWFKTLLGGYWDAMSQGVVISCQEWRYREASIDEDEFDETGSPTGGMRSKPKVLQDSSWVRLVPVENLLFHPSSDWLDPINSSPYLIEMIPYFANELAERIADGRAYGSLVPYIKDFSEQELLSGASQQDSTASSIRMARENTRLDRYSQVQQGQKFRPVWVHRNIVRIKGLDYVYETLGTTILLSEPVPIEDVFGLDYRTYAMGSCTIEPHRTYPSGPVEMVKPTQEVMNDIQNQREDNIKLALNNRYVTKRGSQIDMRALMRNTPGSIIQASDPTNDIKQLESKDVTASAYAEQDRLNLDFDDIAGIFTQSTVGAARNLNERVKGMELMGQGADMVTELALRTLSETWVVRTLSQLVDLQRKFETDQTILAIVGARVQTQNWQQAFKLLAEPTNITVSVGFGNTDPMMRVQRMQIGATTIQQVAPTVAAAADQNEFAREIMGALGYQNGSRFYPSLKQPTQNPQIEAMQQQIQQLQQELQQAQQKTEALKEVAKIKAESAEKIAQIKAQSAENIALGKQAAQHYVSTLNGQIKQLDIQIARESNVIKQGQLLLEREALSNAIMQADREFQLKVATSVATPPQEQPQPGVVPSDEPFIHALQTPASGSVLKQAIVHPIDGKQPKLPGADKAGTIERQHYGMLPGNSG